jgi:hypothetical protein
MNAQLYLAIGVPVVINAAMAVVIMTLVNDRLARLEGRLAVLEARFELLIGKVGELTNGVTRLEERMNRR